MLIHSAHWAISLAYTRIERFAVSQATALSSQYLLKLDVYAVTIEIGLADEAVSLRLHISLVYHIVKAQLETSEDASKHDI